MVDSTIPQTEPLTSSGSATDPDVFSDEHALNEQDTVNGVAGVRTGSREGSPTPRWSIRRSLSSQQSQSESPQNRMRRTRGSQRSNLAPSIRSIGDPTSSPVMYRSVSDLRRTISTTNQSVGSNTSTIMPRAQSPYQGPSGPSQPYAMYHQDASATRPLSVATTSTAQPPERMYSGPDGPTQPYGMYEQNTVGDDEATEGTTSAENGYPVSSQEFRRRLGPDGEDADDLIGPDGYTEQLPPYTRYANGIPPKGEYLPRESMAETPPYAQQRNSVHTQFARHDLTEHYMPPISQSPTTSNPFDDRAAHVLPSSTDDPSNSDKEASGFKERTREKAKRKVCWGVMPCWLLALVLLALCLAIILGGVIGAVVAHHSNIGPSTPKNTQVAAAATNLSDLTPASSTAADAEPISTPTGMPILPVGSFTWSLNNPYTTTNSCLVDPAQNNAWDCSTGAQLNVTVNIDVNNVPTLDLHYPGSKETPFRYGAQPPQLESPGKLALMRDRREREKGPAYYFASAYNKTVIVREHDFPLHPSKTKRSISDGKNESDWTEADMASPTDRPWFCFWNNTVLEGFIYVTQNTASGDTSNNALPDSSAYAAGATSPAATGKAKRDTPKGSNPSYPKTIKMEERRPIQRLAVTPYCQQMQILDNWRAAPLPFPPIQLNENEPWFQNQLQAYSPNQSPPATSSTHPAQSSSRPSAHARRQIDPPNSDCMCVWQN